MTRFQIVQISLAVIIVVLQYTTITDAYGHIEFCTGYDGDGRCNKGTAGAYGVCAKLDHHYYNSYVVLTGRCHVYNNLNCGDCVANGCTQIKKGDRPVNDYNMRSYRCD